MGNPLNKSNPRSKITIHLRYQFSPYSWKIHSLLTLP